MRWSVYVLVLALVCVAPPTVKPERTQQDVEPTHGGDQLGAFSEAALRGLKLGALSKLAVESGVDPGALEQAQDANDPRGAVVQLLLQVQHPGGRRGLEQLNSKTPYSARLAYRLAEAERIHGRALDASADDSVGAGPPSCEPLAAYGVLRHGTRYPTAKDWKKMARLGERVRVQDPTSLPASLNWLSNWTPPVPEHEDGTLHDIGRREHHALARRLQERFPTLFPADLDQHGAYEFSATAKPRTQQSARAFAAGLAGLPFEAIETALPQLEHAPIDADRLLRFHTMCPRYTAEVKENDTLCGGDVGVKGATTATLLPAVARSVRNSLIRAGVTLTTDDQTCGGPGIGDGDEQCEHEWDVDTKAMKAIWKACQWETLLAIDKQQSAWCDFLTAKDMQMMELLGDLDMYWEKGPGLRLPSLMACELLQDAASTLTEWADTFSGGVTSSAPSDKMTASKTTLRFAHAETVVPLLGILGITFGQRAPLVAPSIVQAGGQSGVDKVDNLTAANYAVDVLDDRSWRSSVISPMAANVVLLLQHCQAPTKTMDGQSTGKHPTVEGGVFVTALHNEVPIAIPGCAAAAAESRIAAAGAVDAEGLPLLCPWREGFTSMFQAELNDCNLDKLCEVRQATDRSGRTVDADTGIPAAGPVGAPLPAASPASLMEQRRGAIAAHGTRTSTHELLLQAGGLIFLGLIGLSCIFCACVMPSTTGSDQTHLLYKSNHCKPD